ncbi:head GIN domain-containing protein [Maribacter algarum]|nr:head GIN domain-containing protein [Maribacter algarum]
MKNTVTTLVFLLVAFNAFAQREIVKELDSFNEIKAFDRIKTILIKSDKNKVVITGDDQDEVNISLKDGTLKVKMEFDNQMDGGNVTVKVYHSETLTFIDANEGAKISSEDTAKGDEVKIAAQEGGTIDLNVDIDNLEVKSTSGAEITLTGKATIQEAIANSGGKVYNDKLKTIETKVTVQAGGSASVHASDKMNAKVRAGGSIYIYGNPKDLERDKVFGGKIRVMD